MLKINYLNLLRQTLPPLKRTTIRLEWLHIMLTPLIEMYNQFQHWADLQRMLINVNSRTMVLEGFLRFKYKTPHITISTTVDNLPGIGLLAEGQTMNIHIGLHKEEPNPEFPLMSERQDSEFDVDFRVFVPAHVNVNDVITDIEQYKIPFATYRLVADLYMTDPQGRRMVDKNGKYITVTKQTGYL